MTYVPSLTLTCDRRYSLFVDEEGLRRPLADICMLCFHLVISSVTYKGVDLQMAQTILEWNLKRFPDGEQSLLENAIIPFMAPYRRFLLIRRRSYPCIEKPTGVSYRKLRTCDGRSNTVSKFVLYLVLGNCYMQLRDMGDREVPQELETAGRRSDME